MMLGFLPIRFEDPIWLVLLLLLVPAFFVSRRSIGGLSRTKAYLTFALRAFVITALAVALAHPVWEKRGKGLTVTVVLDRTQSIPVPLRRHAVRFLREAADLKDRSDDRLALITIGKDASIAALPDSYSRVELGQDVVDPTGTNLAAGIRLALAVMPEDTANRIVLASDGNETVDSVLSAAEIAQANNIPIDVLLLEYEYENEVVFEQIVAPPRARQGQTAKVKLVLTSQAEASGTVRLMMNDEYLDLNGDAEGDGLAITLEPGTNVIEQVISFDDSGGHQFEAVFIPDESSKDSVERNNRAVAVTYVSGKGKVLVISDSIVHSQYLVQALRESGVSVEIRDPGTVPDSLVFFNSYDAVVLVNIPKWVISTEQDEMLRAFVHDLGGGLIMIGGEHSFGAGGWIDSQVAKALPVELNPPQTRQMPAGALALIMHSCEMPQGNYWGEKVAESAINALSRLDYAGIVEYAWNPGAGGIEGCAWAFPMQRLGDKAVALNAIKKMQVGDMPAFGPSMQLALQGLMSVPAAQRHVIIISDGDPTPPSQQLLQQFINSKVTVTTVMVGGHGTTNDMNNMRMVATKTGGNPWVVKNPKNLPQIFIKEAQIVSRSLIQEGDIYQPSVVSMLPGPAQGFAAVPQTEGYVLTAPREAGLAQTPIVIATSEGKDPLFAHWNYGLGRSIAFTSDLTERWGAYWAGWERFRAFWEQAVRWVMRPGAPTNMNVVTRLEGDMAVIEVEALEDDASYLNFLRPDALVITPSGEGEILALQQTGPGRYRGTFRVDEAGAYLINIPGNNPDQGDLHAAINVPYAREFRAVKHNSALLRDLAERTGGRVLNATNPQLVDLFYRGDLEVPKSPKRIWDLLAILAAVVLLLDVAARRISVEPKAVAGLAGRAIGRRKEVGASTVSAWKRTRSQVAHRREERKRQPATSAAKREVRFEADETDAKRAIDVGADMTGGAAASPPARPARPAPQEQEEPGDGDYTSRLLAAKRRARKSPEGGDEQGSGDR